MAQNLKLITSRRAYEFRMDDLRLSVLCLPEVQAQIQRMFSFESAVVGTPQETFGPVGISLPPGLVFDIGVLETLDGPAIPIRFLHFEQKRIVIDVAGPSSAIDAIFDRMRYALGELTSPDGSPAIGEVERVLDYSEFSGQFAFSLVSLLNPDARDLVVRASAHQGGRKQEVMVVPTVTLSVHGEDEEYGGLSSTAISRRLQLAVRAGTSPADGIYFSGAPLDSETHRSYLSELEATLAEQQALEKKARE